MKFFRSTIQFEKSPETLESFLLVWEKLVAAKDFKTGLLFVEQIENWQFNQFIPALGNMQMRVKGNLHISWPIKEQISKVDTLSQSNLAEVNKINGFYIFVDSSPTEEYDAIGEVKLDYNDKELISSGGQYSATRDNIIKSARLANYKSTCVAMMFVTQ